MVFTLFMSVKVACSISLVLKHLDRELVGPLGLQQSACEVVCVISDVIRRVKDGYHGRR